MSNESILELTLGGFQVFAEPVTFPLGPITLLFGPNSAGKSAIADALLVLKGFAALFNDGARNSESEILQEAASLLESHWRLEPGAPPMRAPEVQLGIRIRVARDSWADEAVAKKSFTANEYGVSERFKSAFAAIEPWLASEEFVDLDLRLRFSRGEEGHFHDEETVPSELAGFHLKLDISLAGIPILQSERQGRVALQTAHPIFGGRLNTSAYQRLAARDPDKYWLKDGWFGFELAASLSSDGLDAGPLTIWVENDDESAYSACVEFADFFDAIWLSSIRTVRRFANLTSVPASRSIPSLHEVTYLKAADGRDIAGNRFGLRIEGRPEFDSLATCGLLTKLNSEREGAPPGPQEGHQALDTVNRHLAEHMFREKGYFVRTEVNRLAAIRPDERLLIHTTPGQLRDPDGYLVTLTLEDPEGRRFAFDEVGSGLGYVLPVLAALASPRMTFIQQPELHLHPALQAELADALVDGAGQTRQDIVETHSEHLLLRILRRVRQTSAGTVNLELRIEADDLCVVYFDPQPNGTTNVKRLRVSEDGDFVDRWPRGFFTERDEDLFGE